MSHCPLSLLYVTRLKMMCAFVHFTYLKMRYALVDDRQVLSKAGIVFDHRELQNKQINSY